MFRPKFRVTAGIRAALRRIEGSKRAVAELRIAGPALQRLRETALLATTHFSTRIEGNRLTLPEVRAVSQGARVEGRERDESEVRNHFRAMAKMERLAADAGPIAEVEVKRLHGLVMTGRHRASPYRTSQNAVRDAGSRRLVYLPPEAKDVPSLMRELADWINAGLASPETPAPVAAALAHYQFATIHPYLDGNGRTARLLATLILGKAGYGLQGVYSLDEHYAADLPAYYAALAVGSHNYYEGRAEADVTHFVAYFCAGMADAFASVEAAARTPASAAPRGGIALRDVDPRQRRLLGLFRRQGSATSAEMAKALKMSPRTLAQLARDWVASGFLATQNAARKNRSYKLGEAFQALAEGR